MYKNRLTKLQTNLKAKNIDALVVSNPFNVYYLSGFRPLIYKVAQPLNDPEGFLLITQTDCFLLTDQRYEGTAKHNTTATYKPLSDAPRAQNLAKQLIELASTLSVLGFEEDSWLYQDLTALKLELTAIAPHVQTVDCSTIVLDQRLIKDEAELNLLTQAATITSAGYEHALTKLAQGMTEKELAFEITSFFLKEAEGNSFDPIVAFGAGSAVPHYETSSDVKIAGSGILLLDLGCLYKGYCGDMTRTVYLGKAPSDFITRYNYVLEAQQVALDMVTPGLTGNQVHAAVVAKFKDYDLDTYFTHGTGHGVGLAIHENPRLNKIYDGVLENGMIFSVEPGLYLDGWGGIRIEDVVYLKDDKVVNTTPTSKTIVEL